MGGESLLEQGVQRPGAGGSTVHGGEDLHVPAGVEPERGGDAGTGDVYGAGGGGLGVVAGEQEEIRQALEQGWAAGVDAMRVGDDAGLGGLAEDLGQPHPRNGGGGEQIAQHLAGADRGKLVDVPDQEQVGAGWDGLDEFVGEDEVEHGGLVHDEQIDVERVVPIVGGVPAGAQLQQPMHGGGGMSGQLGQALGGTSGRRHQGDLGLLGGGEFDDGTDGEALAAPRPTGQHRDLRGQREPNRLLLLGSEVVTGARPQPGQGLGPVDAHEVRQPIVPIAEQAQQAGGERPLRPVERHQIHGAHRLGVAAGQRVANDPLVGDQVVETAGDEIGGHVEDLRGVRDQLGLGQVAVAVVSGLGECVLQAGHDPLWAVVGDADRLGDGVGGLETDAPHVGRQPVRLLGDHVGGGVAVLLVDPYREGGRDADALKKDHDLLDGLLFLPRRGDLRGAFGAQPGDLHQAARFLLDDPQRVQAEVGDDPFGEHRSDALHQARAEVALDALDRGG